MLQQQPQGTFSTPHINHHPRACCCMIHLCGGALPQALIT